MWSQSLTLKHAKLKIVEKPIADAVGLQIDMNSQKGNLIVNIGADTTENFRYFNGRYCCQQNN